MTSKFSRRLKIVLNKLWFILWKDDSLKGWIISIIFLFLFIKFIFFPVLSLATGTVLPLAIVESCSMYHKGIIPDYDNWWEDHKIKYGEHSLEKEDFKEFTMKNGFNKGDILFIIKAKPERLKLGDIIIFDAGQNNPIIHRLVNIDKQGDSYTFSTIGDNNNGQLNFEKSINENQLIGKAIFKITPLMGWGKLIFFEGAKSPQERGLCKQN
jgi:signal peptidase I